MKNFVKDRDIFAIPVQLTYQGKREISTVLGGTCSILFYLCAILIFALQIKNGIVNPVYSSNSSSSYLSYFTNEESYYLPQDTNTVAVAISTSYPSVMSRRFRVQFYATSSIKGDFLSRTRWIPARRCKDVYAKQIQSELELSGTTLSYYTSEFEETEDDWICPDPDYDYIQLYNDPQATYGMNFVAVVNACAVAQETDKEAGLVSYADMDEEQECFSYEDSLNSASTILVKSKLMTSYFNPYDYTEASPTQQRMQYRNLQSLEANKTVGQRFGVDEKSIDFYNDYFFASLLQNIKTYTFDYLGEISFNDYNSLSVYGFMQLKLSQGSMRTSESYTIHSILAVTANFSALTLTVFSVLSFFLGNYQEFVSDKSMLKRLYGELPSNFDSTQPFPQTPQEEFKKRVEARKEFRFDYWTFWMINVFMSTCCCCVKPCTSCSPKCRERVASYKKFKVAQERLQEEQDLQWIIQSNRLTLLIQKLLFQPRQRRTVNHFEKYVLSDKDIMDDEQNGGKEGQSVTSLAKVGSQVDVLEGFQPDNDAWDRRLLYEVTGIRLRDNEDTGEITSSDDEEDEADGRQTDADAQFLGRTGQQRAPPEFNLSDFVEELIQYGQRGQRLVRDAQENAEDTIN